MDSKTTFFYIPNCLGHFMSLFFWILRRVEWGGAERTRSVEGGSERSGEAQASDKPDTKRIIEPIGEINEPVSVAKQR